MTLASRLYLFFVSVLFGGLLVVFLTLLFPAESKAEPIVTESTSAVTTNGSMTTKVESPPPSAISPQVNPSNSSNLCTVGASGAVQTQILGLSFGSTVRDLSCERILASKTLFSMGMKVAAVSVLCQDPKVWVAMRDAGSPCPINNGMTGRDAQLYWEAHPELRPTGEVDAPETAQDRRNQALAVLGAVAAAALLF
jgi:hypothetical protein